MIDLSVNITPPHPDRTRFEDAWRCAGAQAAALPGAGLYDQNGTEELRFLIAAWLEGIGVAAAPGEVLLCNGAQQGLQVALGLCARQSRLVASEAAVYAGAAAAAKLHGLEWVPVAHDREGMLPEALENALASTDCRTVFATPVCHNPLGFEVGRQRRREIVQVCRHHDAALVEDDVYGFYANGPRLTYRQLAPERTWYVTSFSKGLTPLVRLGLLIPPIDHHSSAMGMIRAQLYGAPPVAWMLAGALIENGAAAAMTDFLRAEASERMALVDRHFGQEHLPMPGGAPHIWLALSSELAGRAVEAALAAGVLISRTEAEASGSRAVDGIRLSIMTPLRRADLDLALGRVAAILARWI